MSKIHIDDIDYYFEDDDKFDATDREDRASRKQKTRTRRKIEYFIERKKTKAMSYDEDSYCSD
jgi:hypothetical protein